jgi:hypothetical protein
MRFFSSMSRSGRARTSARARVHAGAPGLGLEPALGAFQPFRVAQAQVLVADPLRAGQQRIVELHRVEVEVALDLLEPFQRVARRRLQAQHLEPALVLVLGEGRLHRRFGMQVIGQRDGASKASLVPEPMEKCAVAAASPISTTFSWCHFSQSTRGKFIQAEPRRCAWRSTSGCARPDDRRRSSQVAMLSSWLISPNPQASQVSWCIRR